jgi:hypothetical protein
VRKFCLILFVVILLFGNVSFSLGQEALPLGCPNVLSAKIISSAGWVFYSCSGHYWFEQGVNEFHTLWDYSDHIRDETAVFINDGEYFAPWC